MSVEAMARLVMYHFADDKPTTNRISNRDIRVLTVLQIKVAISTAVLGSTALRVCEVLSTSWITGYTQA
jgi:hypothetical protein